MSYRITAFPVNETYYSLSLFVWLFFNHKDNNLRGILYTVYSSDSRTVTKNVNKSVTVRGNVRV